MLHAIAMHGDECVCVCVRCSMRAQHPCRHTHANNTHTHSMFITHTHTRAHAAVAASLGLLPIMGAAVAGVLVGTVIALAVVRSLRRSIDPIPIARENAVLREKVRVYHTPRTCAQTGWVRVCTRNLSPYHSRARAHIHTRTPIPRSRPCSSSSKSYHP